MGRGCTWASVIWLAAALFTGTSRAALAVEQSAVELPSSLRTVVISPGFGLVRTSEMPPQLVDYTIASLMRLATPWPLERAPAETSAVTTAELPAFVAPAPITQTKMKTTPRPKAKLKPQQKTSSATVEFWRGLFWLRIR
jgi:hypothetical protein